MRGTCCSTHWALHTPRVTRIVHTNACHLSSSLFWISLNNFCLLSFNMCHNCATCCMLLWVEVWSLAGLPVVDNNGSQSFMKKSRCSEKESWFLLQMTCCFLQTDQRGDIVYLMCLQSTSTGSDFHMPLSLEVVFQSMLLLLFVAFLITLLSWNINSIWFKWSHAGLFYFSGVTMQLFLMHTSAS